MKRKKVLIAINCMNIGGAPSVVFNHLKYLNKEKFDLYLLMLYKSKPANFLLKIDFLQKDHIFQCSLRHRSPLDFVTWWKIFSFMRREKFDVVMTHLFLTNLIVRSAAICAGVRKIFAFEHSQYTGKKRWQIIVDRILARWTIAIVVAHEAIARFTADQEHISPKKFVVIPNPVSIRVPTTSELETIKKDWEFTEDLFSFFVIGRFSEEKGQKNVLEAVERLVEHTRKFRVYLVGHGPQEAVLKDMIEERGINDVCHLVHDPDRAPLGFALADACIIPSHREGFSLVTAESLMAQVPVIASDLPTIRYIQEKGYGALFPVGDSNALATIMYTWLNEPSAVAEYKKYVTNASLPYAPDHIAAQLAEYL